MIIKDLVVSKGMSNFESEIITTTTKPNVVKTGKNRLRLIRNCDFSHNR